MDGNEYAEFVRAYRGSEERLQNFISVMPELETSQALQLIRDLGLTDEETKDSLDVTSYRCICLLKDEVLSPRLYRVMTAIQREILWQNELETEALKAMVIGSAIKVLKKYGDAAAMQYVTKMLELTSGHEPFGFVDLSGLKWMCSDCKLIAKPAVRQHTDRVIEAITQISGQTA